LLFTFILVSIKGEIIFKYMKKIIIIISVGVLVFLLVGFLF